MEILFVEDDANDQHFLERGVKSSRLQRSYELADNAEEALERLESGVLPNLIVTDLSMPGMGGHAFLERLKSDDRLRHIPVVILSTSEHPNEILKCYQRHANTYFIKPDLPSGYVDMFDSIEDYWFQVGRLPS